MTTIKEIFSQFCKERHAEDKGRNYDLLQETYANTEFFDMTLYKFKEVPLQRLPFVDMNDRVYFSVKNLSLPFQNSYTRISKDRCIYVKEYAPDVLTGALYNINFLGKGNSLNIPFTVRVREDSALLLLDEFSCSFEGVNRIVEQSKQEMLTQIVGVITTLNELSKKAVAVDKPANPNTSEYYRRKRKPTIKIPQRPIYYVLGEKTEKVSPKYQHIRATGNLEYSYCFRVRGHWRRINEGVLGKDRNGNYNVHGYTWVTEYTKGEGELAKRIRAVVE